MSLLPVGISGEEAGYQISRSLRFNSADSAYLNRTPASAGSGTTWTWNAWVKIANTSSGAQNIFSAGNNASGTRFNFFLLNPSNTLRIDANGVSSVISTTPMYRDFSAWYMITVVWDTTQATSSNRVKLYINGAQVTAFATTNYPAQNATCDVNTTKQHFIGQDVFNNSDRFNGYLTEINFIDGQALTPSSFGETDTDTGVWKPKKYTGTYGTNGFYLNFSDNSGTTSTTLGKDYSGNGNNWTPNNFSVTAGAGNDSLVDTPTNYGEDTGVGGEVRGNYATLNPLNKGANLTLANGNLDFSAAGTASNVFATMPFTGGKFYFEVGFATVSAASWGIATKDASLTANIGAGSFANFWGFYVNPTANYVRSGTNPWNNGTITTSSIGQIAVDATNPASVKMWIGVDNIWYDSSGGTTGNPSTGANPTETLTNNVDFFPFFGSGNATPAWSTNFGQRPFSYAAPTGFKALCTQNLPEPTIVDGGEYFNTVLYTGTGATPNAVTGVGFQPDFLWIKSRSNAYSHLLANVITGASKTLQSDSTAAEQTYGCINSFDSDGFTVDTDGTIGANNSGSTFVAWNWKANGAGVSNTAGTITSTVSANTDSGFSIVTYTGTGANATVGHGLGVAPSMVIVKARSGGVESWYVWHTGLTGGTYWLLLNATSAQTNDSTRFTATPTSTVINLGSNSATNGSGYTYVSYCFAAIPGYSAFGSYVGNGSTDGVFLYLGFRPAFVLIKSTGAQEWVMLDSARDTYNVTGNYLRPNSSGAENSGSTPTTSTYEDFLSNGIKFRNNASSSGYTNASGVTYIYAAFAESPFKYSLGR